MKITGIGVDIVDVNRIKKSIKNNNFIVRIFSKKEILLSKKIINKAAFFSKRYAAKEAFVKSLGTGFRNSLNFNDISIVNDKLGKPSFLINNKIKQLIKKKFKLKKFDFFLSISDEKKYSIAFVIFKNNEN
jgi:holo-[acyl-carrier protein] synthase|tara:strand:- start:3120 stop:3512 length:393 start_codon:yes stop_codon:yes gene_type:complete